MSRLTYGCHSYAETIPFAECSEEQCERDEDCALVKGHRDECYLTAWLFDARERDELRAKRAKPRETQPSSAPPEQPAPLEPFDWSRYTGARR